MMPAFNVGRGSRRGIVLLGVLVILTISALIGTTVLFLASAERASAETSLRRTQARALAWSGVQAVMAELSMQREDILAGADPVITEEWTLFGEDEPLAGIYRIMPLSDELPIVSESAKIDVNRAPAAVLEALPGVDGALAAAIIEARPFASVEELVRVEGITYERLYGSGAPGDSYSREAVGGDPNADSSAIQSMPLTDLLTTFSFDPNIQRGLGPDGRDSAGDLRINLNVPWSDRLGRAIERRYDEDAANAVRMIMNRGTQFDSEAALIGVLNEFDVPEEEWARVLDVFTTSPDPYLLGRVDVNRASREVLACLPVIGEDRAEDVISVRQGLDEQTLGSTAWLAAEGVVPRGEFGQCADWVTTRSMQWRVRIEAGFLEQDRAEIAFGSAEGAARSAGQPRTGRSDFGSPFEAEPRLRDKVVLEAVIDISSTRPRVAYLRDVSLLPVAEAIYFEMDSGEIEQSEAGPLAESDPLSGGPGERPAMLDAREFNPFADDDLGGDRSGDAPLAEQGRGPAPSGRAAGRGSGAENGGGTGDPPDDRDEAGRSAGDVPEVGPDRRLGRWTSRTNGQGDGQ
jgi:DNA uptake protein ComE-like DNA-binding protein